MSRQEHKKRKENEQKGGYKSKEAKNIATGETSQAITS